MPKSKKSARRKAISGRKSRRHNVSNSAGTERLPSMHETQVSNLRGSGAGLNAGGRVRTSSPAAIQRLNRAR